MEHAAATRPGKLGVMEPRSAARRGLDVGVGAFAHGAEAVCYFHWWQAPFAQVHLHAGLLRPDSIAAPACEVAQIAA